MTQNILEYVQSKTGAQFKRHGNKHGGEYVGPCPWENAGTDRFHVWPQHEKGQGGYTWCRSCGKSGDFITLLMKIDGMKYGEACRSIGLTPKKYDRYAPKPAPPKKSDIRPVEPQAWPDPDEKWIRQANKFVEACHKELMSNPAALEKLRLTRLITKDTVERFKIGINHQNFYRHRSAWGLPEEINSKTSKPKKLWIPRGIVVPYIVDDNVIRVRVRRPDRDLTAGQKNKYIVTPGSSSKLMVIDNQKQASVIVETELDGMLIFQDAGDMVNVIATGSNSRKPDETSHDILKSSISILVSLDYDDGGATPSKDWRQWYTRAKRWPPAAGKDPGEMAHTIPIRTWIEAGLPPSMRLGPSALQGSDEGAAHKRRVEKVEKETPPKQVGPIEELYMFLKKTPMTIINTARRTCLNKTDKRWSNHKVEVRISELVFLVPESRDYIMGHPAELVNADNYYI